jgi:hypothetical protein
LWQAIAMRWPRIGRCSLVDTAAKLAAPPDGSGREARASSDSL